MEINVEYELENGYKLSNNETWESHFKDFAEKLMREYCIKVGKDEYNFLELEFYFYSAEHQDTVVYPRTCKAGQLFVHYSGFDIAFQTKCDNQSITQFGGILVRSLFNAQTNEVIGGPLRCLIEVFNNQQGKPELGTKKNSIFCDSHEGTKCIGIKSSKKYRFVRKDYWNQKDFKMKRGAYENTKPVYKDKSYTYKFNQEG